MLGDKSHYATFYVEAYHAGKLGTPENPNRGSTSYDAFWKVYSGFRKPSDYRGTMIYAAAVAGKKVREEQL